MEEKKMLQNLRSGLAEFEIFAHQHNEWVIGAGIVVLVVVLLMMAYAMLCRHWTGPVQHAKSKVLRKFEIEERYLPDRELDWKNPEFNRKRYYPHEYCIELGPLPSNMDYSIVSVSKEKYDSIAVGQEIDISYETSRIADKSYLGDVVPV